jgi:hypothetical protein
MGHGLNRKEIQLAGERDFKRETNVFKNALPSKRWYESFTMRHNLTVRQLENRSVARSNAATEKKQERII